MKRKRSCWRLFAVVLAILGFQGIAVGQQTNHCLKIEAAAKGENPAEGEAIYFGWDNQFFIKLTEALPANTDYEFSMDIKAAKSTGKQGCSSQEQNGNFTYQHWDFIGAPTFTQEWQHYSHTGKTATENAQTIAFNLSDFPKSNTYYFDNISFKVGEKELIINGDCEAEGADNFVCFYEKYDRRGVNQVQSAIDRTDCKSVNATSLDISNVSDEITISGDLTGTFDAIYSDEKYNELKNPISEAKAIFDNELIGEQTLTVKYNNGEATKKITVKGNTISSIDFSNIPDQIFLGDALSGKFKVSYTNGDPDREIDIADAHTNLKSDVCGEQNVNIGYDDNHILIVDCGEQPTQTGTWNKQLTLQLTTPLEKNKFYYISFKAKASLEEHSLNSDYSFKILPNGDRWDCQYNAKITQEYTTLKWEKLYDGNTETANISKLSFFLGEFYGKLYLDDFVILEGDANGPNEVEVENITFEEDLNDKWSSTAQPITFKRTTTTEPVKGIKKVTVVPESIEFKTNPTTMEYAEGEDFSAEGGILTVKGKNNVSIEVPLSEATLDATTYDKNQAGKQTLVFTYYGSTATLEVTVKAKTVTEIAIKTNPKVKYFVGDEFAVNQGAITVTYDNGTTADIPMTADMVSGFASAEVGEPELTVTYGGKTVKLKVSVEVKREVASIAVTKPTKTSYFVGDEETLSIEGGKINVTYTTGDPAEIDLSEADKIEGFDTKTAGDKTITVTYFERTATFTVTVNTVEVESVAIKAEPKKVEYFVGEEFSAEDGKITVKYQNGKEEEIAMTAEMISGFDKTKAGTQTITVTYGEKTATFDVTVKAKKELSAIEVKTAPTKVEYFTGEEISLEGGVVLAKYTTGDEEVSMTAEGVKVEGFDSKKAGNQTITVTYGEKTVTFDVTVKEVKAESVAVKTAPTKIEYTEGEEFSAEGGIITVKYNNGKTEDVNITKEMVSGFDASKTGTQTLTVTYSEKSATFEVVVKAIETAVDDKVIGSVVKIWSYEKTVIVENGAGNIVIIDASGRVVKTVSSYDFRTEIQLPKCGMYIVKTGVKTQKVYIQ
jgi:uncharacterized protein YkuJ